MIPRIPLPLLISCLAVIFLGGCAASSKSEYHDYTLAVGQAYPAETQAAQKRVDRYLARLKPADKERIAQYEYLAVESTEVPVNEVPGLSARLAGKGGQNGVYTDRTQAMSKFIMIFDAKSGTPISTEGYIALDTPQKGRLGIFGGYTALYIGSGK